jgi:hypothetical protein
MGILDIYGFEIFERNRWRTGIRRICICIYFTFHQIHIKVQVHIPQDMESVIFHYKMFPLQRNKSMVAVYTYKQTYIRAGKCRFNWCKYIRNRLRINSIKLLQFTVEG